MSHDTNASKSAGDTEPLSHALLQTSWKTICTQPPPCFSAVVTTDCRYASVSVAPAAGVRVTRGSAGSRLSAKGESQSGHQPAETTPPTRRAVVYPHSRTVLTTDASKSPYG
jgi:hypothetical protein